MDNFERTGLYAPANTGNVRGQCIGAQCTNAQCTDSQCGGTTRGYVREEGIIPNTGGQCQGVRREEFTSRGPGYNTASRETFNTTGQREGLGERIMDKVEDFASGHQGQGLRGNTGLTGDNYERQNESLGERIKDRVQGVLPGGQGQQFNNTGRPYTEGGQEFAGSSARPMYDANLDDRQESFGEKVKDKLEQGARMIGLKK